MSEMTADDFEWILQGLQVDNEVLRFEVKELQADKDASEFDNERLRKLMKRAEFVGHSGDHPCPWCGVWGDELHVSECEAFTPEGRVK